MTDSSTPKGHNKSASNRSGERKPKKAYRKPEILSVETMEIVAAVCTYPGKADYGACPSGPISS